MTNDVIDLQLSAAGKALDRLEQAVTDTTPMFRAIAGALEAETERNFAAQGRPAWVPLSKATIAARLKRNRGSTVLRILQDRGILAASVTSDYGADFALIGAGGAAAAYAGVHQFGATITHPPYSTKVRLRTDAKGNLLRQGEEGRSKNLAVFAKDSHKRARESWHEVGEYTVRVPARPYLPFTGSAANAVLQPEAAKSVMDVVERFLQPGNP
jgi:phage virion morphogenesis protein